MGWKVNSNGDLRTEHSGRIQCWNPRHLLSESMTSRIVKRRNTMRTLFNGNPPWLQESVVQLLPKFMKSSVVASMAHTELWYIVGNPKYLKRRNPRNMTLLKKICKTVRSEYNIRRYKIIFKRIVRYLCLQCNFSNYGVHVCKITNTYRYRYVICTCTMKRSFKKI
jgi:hypothetical protein